MARGADWIEFCLREAVVGVAGVIALHAEHAGARRRPPVTPQPGDDLAAGTAALLLVGITTLGKARRVLRSIAGGNRRNAPAKPQTGRRI